MVYGAFGKSAPIVGIIVLADEGIGVGRRSGRPSGLRLPVVVPFQEFDLDAERLGGVVVGVAPVPAVQLGALQFGKALAGEIGAAFGQVARPEGNVVDPGALRLEQVAPGAPLG